MGKKICMILGWVKKDDYWTNISSPDFDRDLKYRGHLETRKHVLSDLRGIKKNGMRLLWHLASQLLRQDGTTDTGSILWGCTDIPGSGSSASPVQEVRESETGETPLAVKESVLHEAILLLRGAEMSSHDRQGCSKRTETGLARGKSTGQRVHAGAASEKSSGCAPCNRDRRNIPAEGTYLSNRSKRFGTKETDLVWRGGQI